MNALVKKLGYLLRGDPTRLNVDPPVPAPDRSGLAVVIIVRNEERHIEDWLRFHMLAGARSAIVYDNRSIDATANIARNFDGMEVTVIPWITDIHLGSTPLKRQPLAYAHAVCTFGAHFRWMTFIDVDEYIVPIKGNSIPEVLSEFEQFTNVSLPWTMFGTAGRKTSAPEPAVYAYETRSIRRLPEFTNFKCIVDPCEVNCVSAHKYWTRSMGAASINDRAEIALNHKERRTVGFATADKLQLNHYYTFSEEELDRKISRETVSHQVADMRAKVVRRMANAIEKDTTTDTTARDFLTRKGLADWRDFRRL